MKAKKVGLRDGGCNFCTPNYKGDKTVYQYDTVYQIRKIKGYGLTATICQPCIDSLNRQIAEDKS
jgi:hypothetical protein